MRYRTLLNPKSLPVAITRNIGTTFPYLGLGPAAHSFKDDQRWWNVRDLDRYCEMIHQGAAPVEQREILSPEQRYLEELLLGFRTAGGIDLDLVAHHPRAEKIINDLQEEHLITIVSGRAIPTRTGFLVADSLPLLFVECQCH